MSETEQTPEPARTWMARGAGVFAWGVWFASLAIASTFAWAFGPDVPRWDDYAVVDRLCGVEPVTASWLWSQHSEHRIPLARLILLGVFRLDGADPRPVLLIIVGLLGASAAALLGAVRRVRGRYAYTDAYLPLVVLNLGQYENFLWAIQVTYTWPAAIIGVVLALVATAGERPKPARCLAIGLALATLPLCNAGGLLLVAFPSLWLGAVGLAAFRAGEPRRGLCAWLSAAPALALGTAYLVGYAAPKHHAASVGLAASARSALQVLATSLGPVSSTFEPWPGLLLAATITVAGVSLSRTRGPSRTPALGVLCVLGAVAFLTLAIGWGRSGEGPAAGLQPRYATFAAPGLAALYFAFALFGPGRVRTAAAWLLFLGFCALIPSQAGEAWTVGWSFRDQASAFDRDRAAGVPPYRLARAHAPFLHPSGRELHRSLAMLRGAGVGKFAAIVPDPAFEERVVAGEPKELRMARWDGGVIETTDVDPWVQFDVPVPARVAGVRLRYDHANDDGLPARFRMGWRRPGQYWFPAEQQVADWTLPTGEDRETVVWIEVEVDSIRIQPDNRPCRFRVRSLTLLVDPLRDAKAGP